jgi:hypothetical protein
MKNPVRPIKNAPKGWIRDANRHPEKGFRFEKGHYAVGAQKVYDKFHVFVQNLNETKGFPTVKVAIVSTFTEALEEARLNMNKLDKEASVIRLHKEPAKKVVEVQGVKIAIPEISKEEANKENWKYPPTKFKTKSEQEAVLVSRAFEWFLGQSDIEIDEDEYIVSSKGYVY